MNIVDGLQSLLLNYERDARWLVTFLLQATLPLMIGLLALRAAQRHSPRARLFIANCLLVGLFGLLASSFCVMGRYRSLWTVQLPGPSRTAFYRGGNVIPGTSAFRNVSKPAQPAIGLAPEQRAAPHSVAAVRSLYEFSAANTLTHRDRRDTLRPSILSMVSRPNASARAALAAFVATAPGRLAMVILYLLLVGLWGAGAMFLLTWLALSCLTIWNVRRRCTPVRSGRALAILVEQCAEMNVSPPQLLVSDRAHGPLLTGLWRPAIILPGSYDTDFEGETLRAVLTHELAHLVQGDGWWLLLTRLLCAVAWPHPLLWRLCRLRAEACEETCDLIVLAQGCSGSAYAHCLLALAERLRPAYAERAATLGIINSRFAVGRRIERILAGLRHAEPAFSIHMKIPILLLIPVLICAALFAVSITIGTNKGVAEVQSVPRHTNIIGVAQGVTQSVSSAQAASDDLENAMQQMRRDQEHQNLVERAAQLKAEQESLLADQMARQAAQLQVAQVEFELKDRQAELASINSDLAALKQAQASEQAAESALVHAQQALRVQQANLQQQQAKENLDQVTYDRYKSLLEKGLVSQEDLDQAFATLKVDQAGVVSAQAAMEVAEADVASAQAAVQAEKAAVQAAQAAVSAAQAKSHNAAVSVAPSLSIHTLSVIFGDGKQGRTDDFMTFTRKKDLHNTTIPGDPAVVDNVSGTVVAWGLAGRRANVIVLLVCDYLDNQGSLLASKTTNVANDTRVVPPSGRFDLRWKPRMSPEDITLNAPIAQTVRLQYHYEVRAHIADASGPGCSDSKASSVRTMKIKIVED